MGKVLLCPSMMCADILKMERVLADLKAGPVDYLHIDVMDGHFVPNFMIGTDFAKQLRRASDIPLDVHMMVERPENCLEWFDPQPGELFSIHAESTVHLQRVLAKVRESGAKPLVAVNPATPLSAIEDVLPDVDGVLVMTVNPGYSGQRLVPQTLDKIARLRNMLDEAGFPDTFIQVDGNVSIENAIKMRNAGADAFVLGTSCIFKGDDMVGNIREFIENVR